MSVSWKARVESIQESLQEWIVQNILKKIKHLTPLKIRSSQARYLSIGFFLGKFFTLCTGIFRSDICTKQNNRTILNYNHLNQVNVALEGVM